MKHQFIKAAAASPDIRVADPAYNAQKIVEIIQAQAKKGTELLVFPELSLCGYTCGELFLQKQLLDGCLSALLKVAASTKDLRMLVYVGLPVMHGTKLYNCAAAVANGRVLGLIPKRYLPNFGEYYEKRYFAPAPDEASTVLFGGNAVPLDRELLIHDLSEPEISVGCEICEDLWTGESPSIRHAKHGAVVIVNLSASNEVVGKREYRHKLLAAQARKNICAYIYADAGEGESTSDMIFSGNNILYESDTLLSESLPFGAGLAEGQIDAGYLLHERMRNTSYEPLADGPFHGPQRVSCDFLTDGEPTLSVDPSPFVPHTEAARKEQAELILNLQAHALARRLSATNAKTAVIGVSGGLDSTLALLVACRAADLLKRPRGDVLAVTMPGFGTSLKTKNSATALMQALGVGIRTVNISQTVLRHFKDIGHDPENTDVTYENAQARYRTMVLMDLANETGGLVIGTGDLSELALGWCTYNGDHMSMYAVNASVPKTLVKHLVLAEAERLGGRAEVVLKSVLSTEISPELLPTDQEGNIAQRTEDIIGPYELHDFYLYHFLRRGDTPAKTLCLAELAFAGKYDRATLKKWLVLFYRRFFSQQFKRNCMPDGVKVGPISLSPRADWRMPSDASAALWIEEAENL